jgi:hypothetical protein
VNTYERTYRGVSLLATEYFRALLTISAHEGRLRELCGGDAHSLEGTYDIVREDPDGKTASDTYTIVVSTRETYDLMQKVFTAESG